MQELVAEFVTGWDMHHIVNKQSMHDEVRTLALHENCLLTVHRRVSILLHPVRDANMPSSGGLFGTIHAFEKQENMTFGYRFGPPVRWANIYLFAFSHFSVEECLPRISLQ